MERLANLYIILLSMILLVPPMFAEGGVFDVTYTFINEHGVIVTGHGLYEDNVWASLLFLCLTISCFIIPRAYSRMWKSMKRLSIALCGWFTASFLFELANFSDPFVVFNSFDSNMIVPKFITAFSLIIIYIFTSTQWKSTKS